MSTDRLTKHVYSVTNAEAELTACAGCVERDPRIALKDAEIARLKDAAKGKSMVSDTADRAILDDRGVLRVYRAKMTFDEKPEPPFDTCAGCCVKQAEIARLRALVCEEPIEHGAVAAIREVLALTDDNRGFVDDDVARVVVERNRLRALVAVGREMAEAQLQIAKQVDLLKDCEVENTRLREEIARLKQALLDADAYNGKLKTVEFVNKELQAKLEVAHEDVRALAEDLQMAQGQWGDDYLWKKWKLSESLARLTVRKIVEEGK